MVGSWGRGRWVFVKKKAPLGRKAERKWRIADLGLELILRAKKAAAAEADTSMDIVSWFADALDASKWAVRAQP